MSVQHDDVPTPTHGPSGLAELLRCLDCRSPLEPAPDGSALACPRCGRAYPVVDGTVRMLLGADDVSRRTSESFAYEWEHFGDYREEWSKNFRDYLQPLPEAWFADKLVLDVGAGSGRHSRRAADLGARVVAVDAGEAIDVARGNLPPEALTVQADARALPFDEGTFDLVMSIGVLHHLPDTEGALRGLVPYARPGGRVHVYLYWAGEVGWHRLVLRAVTAARRVTVRLPHRLLHALCYPIAGALFAGIVLPHRALRHRRLGARIAVQLPLKFYADYPFSVCVNDQFDRFSAPIEQRFERAEVERMLRDAGLEDVQVLPNHGWVGSGRRPA